MYGEIAPLWAEVSRHLRAAAQTADQSHLTVASALLLDLAEREHDAMRTLAEIGSAQTS
jgi:hypothetical protein